MPYLYRWPLRRHWRWYRFSCAVLDRSIGGRMLAPFIVVDGGLIGTWRRLLG